MPATTVHLGFALLVAAALLPRERFDRALLAVFGVVIVFPDLDAIPGWWLPGAHRAMFHTLVLVAIAAAGLYYDVRVRDRSRLRAWGGDSAPTVAWGLLGTILFAHLFLDWAHLSGINLVYPIGDQFFRLEGEVVYSTADGWIQTFVEVDLDGGGGADGDGGGAVIDVGQQGSTDDVHVPTPTDPEPGSGVDRNVERTFPIAVDGWQLYMMLIGAFTLCARRLQGEPPADALDE